MGVLKALERKVDRLETGREPAVNPEKKQEQEQEQEQHTTHELEVVEVAPPAGASGGSNKRGRQALADTTNSASNKSQVCTLPPERVWFVPQQQKHTAVLSKIHALCQCLVHCSHTHQGASNHLSTCT